jgi:hypothetical protein
MMEDLMYEEEISPTEVNVNKNRKYTTARGS